MDSTSPVNENIEVEKKFHRDQISHGTLQEIEILLNEGYAINAECRGPTRGTPLYFAVARFQRGDMSRDDDALNIVKLLLINGAKINLHKAREDEDVFSLNTPLHHVLLYYSEMEKIKLILEECSKGKDLSELISPDINICKQREKVVEFLLNNRSDYNIDVRDFPVLLYFALEKNDIKSCEKILQDDSVPDVNTIISQMINKICMNGTCKMLQTLIDLGINIDVPDINGKTLLHTATKLGFIDKIYYLIDCEASLYQADNEGNSVLHHSVEFHKASEIIEIILRRGGDVNIKNTLNGATALHVASKLDVVKTLIKRGADVHAKDVKGKTPFLAACENSREEILCYLLEVGANINVTCNEGLGSLHYACKSANDNKIQVIKLLLNQGVDINSKDVNGKTPIFHIPSEKTNCCVIKLLVEKGADVNVKDYLGNTVLHYACKKIYDSETVGYFLEENGDVNEMNQEEETPLECALKVEATANHDKKSFKYLIAFLSKIETQGLKISDKNRELIKSDPFYAKCKLEFQKMKTSKIVSTNDLCFFDLLQKDVHNLAVLFRDTEIKQVLEPDNYLKAFPSVRDLLSFRMEPAKYRFHLLHAASTIFEIETKCKLPCTILDKVFAYLEIMDLKNIVKAFPIQLREHGCYYYKKYAHLHLGNKICVCHIYNAKW